MNNLEIGNRIKTERERCNLTLKDIADDIGVAVSTIQRYENGLIKDIKLPIIQAIANSLKVNPNWLIGKDSNKTATNVLSGFEKQLLNIFNNLNNQGKQKALERIKELNEIPRYKNHYTQEQETVKIVARGEGITEIPQEEFDRIIKNAIKLDPEDYDKYF